jgi:putative flavoprotein involved in K+ transport
VRWLSGLQGAPIARGAGRWPHRDDFVRYLERLAERRKLDVRFGIEVRRIDRSGQAWRLESSAGPFLARFVVVATGYDRVPQIPDWPGRQTFEGQLVHASEYRNPEPFRSKDVLVVGAGNSGTEIATQLASAGAARVRVAMRTPVNIVPRDLLGIPITMFARIAERQPCWLVDRFGVAIQRLCWGDLTSYGMPSAPYGVGTELKVKGLGPVVDSGFVAALKNGRVELVGAVEGFEGPRVVLAGGTRIRPDAVIAATGYRHGLETLVGHLGVLLPSGKPAVLGARTHPAAHDLYFNGFWLPMSGQLPAMRRTSRRIARAVAGERRRPSAVAALGRSTTVKSGMRPAGA